MKPVRSVDSAIPRTVWQCYAVSACTGCHIRRGGLSDWHWCIVHAKRCHGKCTSNQTKLVQIVSDHACHRDALARVSASTTGDYHVCGPGHLHAKSTCAYVQDLAMVATVCAGHARSEFSCCLALYTAPFPDEAFSVHQGESGRLF